MGKEACERNLGRLVEVRWDRRVPRFKELVIETEEFFRRRVRL